VAVATVALALARFTEPTGATVTPNPPADVTRTPRSRAPGQPHRGDDPRRGHLLLGRLVGVRVGQVHVIDVEHLGLRAPLGADLDLLQPGQVGVGRDVGGPDVERPVRERGRRQRPLQVPAVEVADHDVER
jgi:hypothetical protein